jgi:hypothetical protein
MLALWTTSGAGDLILFLDVVAFSASVIVVIDRTIRRFLGMEGRNFRHWFFSLLRG